MIKGTTKTGFRFSIDEEARDDMEILENLAAISEGHIEAIPKTLTSLLGEKQKAKLYEHCRGKSGRVLSTRVMEELQHIFEKAGEESKEIKN